MAALAVTVSGDPAAVIIGVKAVVPDRLELMALELAETPMLRVALPARPAN